MSTATIPQLAAALADGAAVIDVRELGEYVTGHVTGAQFVPMSQLSSRVHELDRTRPLYVICASGNRSRAVADYLVRVGFDARTVEGGTSAWARAGHRVITGVRANAA